MAQDWRTPDEGDFTPLVPGRVRLRIDLVDGTLQDNPSNEPAVSVNGFYEERGRLVRSVVVVEIHEGPFPGIRLQASGKRCLSQLAFEYTSLEIRLSAEAVENTALLADEEGVVKSKPVLDVKLIECLAKLRSLPDEILGRCSCLRQNRAFQVHVEEFASTSSSLALTARS